MAKLPVVQDQEYRKHEFSPFAVVSCGFACVHVLRASVTPSVKWNKLPLLLWPCFVYIYVHVIFMYPKTLNVDF